MDDEMIEFGMEDMDFDMEFEILGDDDDVLETDRMPDVREAFGVESKMWARKAMKTRNLDEIMPGGLLPAGVSHHIVTRGTFDSWNFLPWVVERYGHVNEYWFTTWALNRENVVGTFGLFDAGRVEKIFAFVGTYLKRRETAVFGLLLRGLEKRGQRMKAFKNHTKIQLFRTPGADIVVVGSANLTANGNCENFVVTVDGGLFEFYREWLREVMEI